jgi:hypothetical protein
MKKFTNLSSDVEDKKLNLDSDEIPGKIEIESIVDIFVEPEKESTSGANENLIAVNTDLANKEVKRGDVVYITAFIRREGQSMTSPSTQSVLKLRVIDIYQGLSQLNRLL